MGRTPRTPNALRAFGTSPRPRAGTVGILQDLSGPKIRTGPLAGDRPLPLKVGDALVLAAGNAPSQPGRIFTPYAELVRSAKPGDRLLLDDGRIELRVVASSAAGLDLVVVHGGDLGAHKGINAPGVALPASALTDKDVEDLRFGLTLGVDVVALSFVQTAEDVARARAIISEAGRATPIIAKIERPAAIENLDAILRLVQGVMVARGDLGLEMPLEQVPRVQKAIIRSARSLGLPAIVATQVLESMRVDPRPTRAEVSDAANSVDEGADAIMLAGETAAGAFPVKAVQTLDAVIRDAESLPPVLSLAGFGNGPAAADSHGSRAWAGVGAGGGHPRDDWSGGRDRGSHDARDAQPGCYRRVGRPRRSWQRSPTGRSPARSLCCGESRRSSRPSETSIV